MSTLHAIILAGGNGERVRASAPTTWPPKPLLQRLDVPEQPRLIDAALQALPAHGRRIVVSAPVDLPPGVERVREDPPLGGPAAGIAVGVAALDAAADEDLVVVLAGDLVDPQSALDTLLGAQLGADGVMATSGGQEQPLLSVLRLGSARRAFDGVTGGSVRRAFSELELTSVEVLEDASWDIDSYSDAVTHQVGVSDGPASWICARDRVAAVASIICAEHRQHSHSTPPRAGLVLAEDASSPMPVPHYTSSAMDGYAVVGAGPWRLKATHPDDAEGRNLHKTPGVLAEGEALPVLTGSLLPDGAGSVVRTEHTRVDGDMVHLLDGRKLSVGADIRHAGEELAEHDVLVAAGTVLGPRHVALLATCGVDEVRALPEVSVDLAFTGNEVITAGIPGPGEVRDAFSDSFPALLEQAGAVIASTTRLADDASAVSDWLAQTRADVVVLTGGSGHSGQDFARRAITAQADEILTESVRCSPGHPALLATRTTAGGRQFILGAPGNPLAAHVALHSFLIPAITVARGQAFPETRACVSADDLPAIDRFRVRLMPAALTQGGAASVMTHTHSHMLSGYAHADVLLIVPREGLKAGQAARYVPLR